MKFIIALGKVAEVNNEIWQGKSDCSGNKIFSQSADNSDVFFTKSEGYNSDRSPVLTLDAAPEYVLELLEKKILDEVKPYDISDMYPHEFTGPDKEVVISWSQNFLTRFEIIGDSSVKSFAVLGREDENDEYTVLMIAETSPTTPISTVAKDVALSQRTTSGRIPYWVGPFLNSFKEEPELQEKAGKIIPFPLHLVKRRQ